MVRQINLRLLAQQAETEKDWFEWGVRAWLGKGKELEAGTPRPPTQHFTFIEDYMEGFVRLGFSEEVMSDNGCFETPTEPETLKESVNGMFHSKYR